MRLLFFQIQREIALVLVQLAYFRHFFARQSKVEDVYVLRQMLWVCGLGEDNIPFLDMPPQDDLCAGLAIFLSQAVKKRLVQKSDIAVSQWIPAFDDRSIWGDAAFQGFLLIVGMAFHLKGGGLYLCRVQHFL